MNWASGQELALRSMAWLVGGAAFGDEMSAAEWHNLVELIYWHGVQIEAEFGFSARAVRNNHLLAEALALAQIADVFDCFSEAKRWRKLGLDTFAEAVSEQFFDDGGYCQCSHTYHHFALELVLDAAAWFPELHDQLYPVLEAAERFFGALLDHGRLPNFGPNDRLDAPDFEALLAAIRTVVEPTAPRQAASFDDAGLHILRSDATTATLRCGPLPDRAGHDDGLHVEVWAHGQPLAIDAGSYRYGGPDHDWFAGAWSHNICMSGSSSPRELLSTFTWDRLAYPHLEEFDPERLRMTASYDAYRDIRWERTVSLQDGTCTVEDLLDPIDVDPPTLQKLHWLIDARPQDVVVESVDNYTWTISTPKAKIVLAVTAVIGQLSRTQLRTEPGWSSTTYGKRTLVTSLQLSTHCPAVRFQTTFTPR